LLYYTVRSTYKQILTMDSLNFLRSCVCRIGRRKLMIAVIAVSTVLLSGPLLFRKLSIDDRWFLIRGNMILLIEAVLFTGSWYVWTRLRCLLDSLSTGACSGYVVYCTRFTRLVVAVMLFLAQMSFIVHYFIHAEDPPLLSLLCFVCLGILFQFIICYFCLGRVYQLICWARRWHFAGTRADCSLSVQWTKFITALLFSVSISVYGLYGGLKAPAVKTVEVPIKGLAASMDRLSVAVISDIHLGPTVGRTKLERVVLMVNSLQPGLYHSFIYALFSVIL